MRLVNEACNVSMPKMTPKRQRQPTYWWTEEIAELRRAALAARRRAQRERERSGPGASSADAVPRCQRHLKRAIRMSKSRCWRELCKQVDEDMWGLGYRIVIGRIRRQAPEPPTAMAEFIGALFLEHRERAPHEIPVRQEEIPIFTVEELRAVGTTFGNRKAPGSDGIPTEVVKTITKEAPYMLLNMYNACLLAGVFLRRWKMQRLVLLDKGKGPPVTPSSFKPFCMLDNAGKVFEKMLRARLRAAIKEAGDLVEWQH